jgi:hypothetical protein
MKVGFDGGIKLEFQIAGVAIDKRLFAEILARIKRLRYYSLNNRVFNLK